MCNFTRGTRELNSEHVFRDYNFKSLPHLLGINELTLFHRTGDNPLTKHYDPNNQHIRPDPDGFNNSIIYPYHIKREWSKWSTHIFLNRSRVVQLYIHSISNFGWRFAIPVACYISEQTTLKASISGAKFPVLTPHRSDIQWKTSQPYVFLSLLSSVQYRVLLLNHVITWPYNSHKKQLSSGARDYGVFLWGPKMNDTIFFSPFWWQYSAVPL